MSIAEHQESSFLGPGDQPLYHAPQPAVAVPPVVDLICGSVGGLACVLAGQPFDTVKTRLQAAPRVYRTIPTCIKKTLLEGGIRPFYHGATPAITSNVVENASLFLFYGQCQRLVQSVSGAENSEALSVQQRGMAGSLAAVFTSVLISPLEMFKCRLQVHRKMGAWNVIHQIYKEEGWRGYFRGLTSTWAREVPGYYCFFLTYEAARKWLAKPGQQSAESLEGFKVILAGGLAGCGFWTVAYPLDSVKSRIQAKMVESGSLVKVAAQMFKNEGILSFYKGLSSAVIRSFPANAALFLAYEASKHQLTKLAGGSSSVH